MRELEALRQENASLRQRPVRRQASPHDEESPAQRPRFSSPPAEVSAADSGLGLRPTVPSTSSAVVSAATLTAPAAGFAPLSAVGVPNVAPGVDLAPLLKQRQSARLSRAGDPSVKIDGSDRRAFRPWERAISQKIQANLPVLLYHSEQIDFALSQMSGNLLTSMSHWISVRPDATFQAFLSEVESFLGVQFLAQEAREKLRSIRQSYPNETVSELYTRMVPLFNDAHTPTPEQIERFLDAIHGNIARNLSSGRYDSLEQLRDVAVLAEARYRRFDTARSSSSRSSGTRGSLRSRDTSSHDAPSQFGAPLSSDHYANNRKLCPTITKPAGWLGLWVAPSTTQSRVTPRDRERLKSQLRCFSCRGSGHTSGFAQCPMHVADSSKRFNMINALASASESSATQDPPKN